MAPTPDIDGMSLTELEALVVQLLKRLADQERTIIALRDENARLKGQKGRPGIKPPIKPSGMDKATRLGPPKGPRLAMRPRQHKTASFLSAHPVFTRAEFAAAFGHPASAANVTSLLRHHLRAGNIKRVSREVLAAVPAQLAVERMVIDRFRRGEQAPSRWRFGISLRA
jgi:hypothetical protein